jgi:hypothetical protein
MSNLAYGLEKLYLPDRMVINFKDGMFIIHFVYTEIDF